MKFQFIFLMALTIALTACTGNVMKSKFSSVAGHAGLAEPPPAAADVTPVNPEDPFSGGAGASVAGKGSMTVPTGEAVVERLKIGLENNVSPLTGNFARSLAQVKTNLPKFPDPTKATGFDQIQLLVYAACSDLTTGNTPLMQTRYGVTKAGTVTAQQAALVAAGVKMLDQYTAGLASQGPSAAQVTTALQTLVQKVSAAPNNATIAFMSVCIAANTAGSSMMSF